MFIQLHLDHHYISAIDTLLQTYQSKNQERKILKPSSQEKALQLLPEKELPFTRHKKSDDTRNFNLPNLSDQK